MCVLYQSVELFNLLLRVVLFVQHAAVVADNAHSFNLVRKIIHSRFKVTIIIVLLKLFKSHHSEILLLKKRFPAVLKIVIIVRVHHRLQNTSILLLLNQGILFLFVLLIGILIIFFHFYEIKLVTLLFLIRIRIVDCLEIIRSDQRVINIEPLRHVLSRLLVRHTHFINGLLIEFRGSRVRLRGILHQVHRNQFVGLRHH